MLPGNYGVLLVASDSKSDLCLFLVSIQNATFSFWTYFLFEEFAVICS